MPQRADWEHIVVATPAYKAFEMDGVADKLQGLGISMHPLRNGLSTVFSLPSCVDSLHGDKVLTPEGRAGKSDVYLAPYAYLAIWVLDPKSLAVLDESGTARQPQARRSKVGIAGTG